MIVFDASTVIALLAPHDVHHASALALVDREAGQAFVASVITHSEILVGYAHGGRLAEGRRRLRRLEMAEVPLGALAAPQLAQLRATTRLKLPDCCVLLAAQDSGAETIATFDDRLAGAARELGLAVASA